MSRIDKIADEIANENKTGRLTTIRFVRIEAMKRAVKEVFAELGNIEIYDEHTPKELIEKNNKEIAKLKKRWGI